MKITIGILGFVAFMLLLVLVYARLQAMQMMRWRNIMQNTVSNHNTPSFLKASSSRPNMGLNNKICINPKYWCRLHEVWLSEDDVLQKNCKNKPTFDLIGTYRCGCLEERNLENGYK